MTNVEEFIQDVESVYRSVRAGSGEQIFAQTVKTQLRDLAGTYFQDVRAAVSDCGDAAARLNEIFQALHEASRKNPSRARVASLLKESKQALLSCESSLITRMGNPKDQPRFPTDELIIQSLDEICQTAAAAYQQALLDLRATDRLSWRGPATDLREALRETLDVLAPDKDVAGVPNFKLEGEAKRPTMKQKVRYVLKSRGVASGAMATPEQAVSGVEEIVGGLTRSVYDRSSVSTHTPSDRTEVMRVLSWVRLVMCELLEVPHH
jgi:hypothetical protein